MVILYGSSWFLSGQVGFGAATIHPMVIICTVMAAYYGVAVGLTALALALVPLVGFDLHARGIDEPFQSYSLEVLFWPALSGVAVLVLGSFRDLRENQLADARRKIEQLRLEVESVLDVSDAALAALKQNEAQIAMRQEISPLYVLKALERLTHGTRSDFEKNLSQLLRLVAPDAEYALLASDGAVVSSSAAISEATLASMRSLVPGAAEDVMTLDPADGDEAKGTIVAACRVSDRSGLVIGVATARPAAAEDLADYLPEIARAIDAQAPKLVPAGRRRRRPRAVA
ncbi:hypothetical protein [Jannaschia ovalis]|uniref:Histidine kinase n=1 Tax=Jannaschia ovalis TaxID=3038773 RepID=A0ABY8LBL6_9RHOB|nr:hypothetical protein [Jannaschia sp. GRR-S6-38]WGH78731.1 hypothetical protein P8627_00265 [Jannaschia sp. GRR-S6-38]